MSGMSRMASPLVMFRTTLETLLSRLLGGAIYLYLYIQVDGHSSPSPSSHLVSGGGGCSLAWRAFVWRGQQHS